MKNTPTRLSPTAQTVLDSFLDTDSVIGDRRYLYTETKALAAALVAVADQVVPLHTAPKEMRDHDLYRLTQRLRTRCDLLAIAAELERHYDSLYS